MRHGYFFDLDGTLVDTHESNTCAYFRAIKEALPGARVDEGELHRRIANGEHCADFLRALVPEISDAQIHEVAALKARAYPDYIPLSRLNSVLVGRIDAWREEKGAVIALVTTAKRENARKVLEFHGIGGLFDIAVFGDDVARLKPFPDLYLRALELAGLHAGQVIAFEDSQSGLAAARAAGIRVERVEWAVMRNAR